MWNKPRIEINKRRSFSGHAAERNFIKYGLMYSEDYEVRVLQPNRPLQYRNHMTRQQADSYARMQLRILQGQGFDEILYNGRIVKVNPKNETKKIN